MSPGATKTLLGYEMPHKCMECPADFMPFQESAATSQGVHGSSIWGSSFKQPGAPTKLIFFEFLEF